jgi:hypothetical protein
MSEIAIFQQLTDTRLTQPLQMAKCASNLVQRTVSSCGKHLKM